VALEASCNDAAIMVYPCLSTGVPSIEQAGIVVLTFISGASIYQFQHNHINMPFEYMCVHNLNFLLHLC